MIDIDSIPYLDLKTVETLIQTALREDLGDTGDITTESVVPEAAEARATLTAKADGVLSGLPFFEMVFKEVDKSCSFQFEKFDGDRVSRGDTIMFITGPARSLLIAERTALNLLSRLSGIATLTAEYVEAVSGTKTAILDTRKTTPGLRILEKYAVFCGGGQNHRIGLFDAFLIKENHIAMGGGISLAVESARKNHDLPVQVEVENLEQLEEAINAGADSVLLDNMSPADTAKAVKLARKLAGKKFQIESSGGITMQTIRSYAEAGVDRISTGALTHSASALDLSLKIIPFS